MDKKAYNTLTAALFLAVAVTHLLRIVFGWSAQIGGLDIPPIGGSGRIFAREAAKAEMGRYVVKLPDIGEGTTEAEIVAWHVRPGQAIREEDPLVDVMTDKATVELPAPMAGTVVAINGAVGDKRPVGSELVVLEVAGEGNVADSPDPHPPAARAAGPPSPAVRERVKAARPAPLPSLSRTAGEGAERSEAGEGA